MEEAPKNHPSATSQRYSDTGATLARAHAREPFKSKRPMLTAAEIANLPVNYLVCKKSKDKSVRVVTMPDAYEFDVLQLVTATKTKEKWMDVYDYRVRCPCLACFRCVIVRTIDHGHLVDESYHCTSMNREVDRWGSCSQSAEGKGPMVLVIDTGMNLHAERTSEGEIKTYNQPQALTVFAEDMKDPSKTESQKPQKGKAK